MAENAVTLVGSLGTDPVMRSGGRGDFATFSLAVSSRYRDTNGAWVDGPTSWFDVSADGALGRNAASSLTKGQRILVHGTVGTRDVSKQDGSRTRYVQVRADAIGPDLKFGTATFTRAGVSRPDAPPPATTEQLTADEQRGEWGGPPRQQEQLAAQPAGWSGAFAEADETPF